MSGTPRPYDENFIAEQLAEMEEKNWTTQEIAGWFARWGYEEGKAVFLMPSAATPTENFVQVLIEEVQPGDVARTDGGREFSVEECDFEPYRWSIKIGSTTFVPHDPEFFELIGITFWRKVPPPTPHRFRGRVESFHAESGRVMIALTYLEGCPKTGETLELVQVPQVTEDGV